MGADEQRIAMTTHSPAYRSISTRSEQKTPGDLYTPVLSRIPYRPRSTGAEVTAWRGAWQSATAALPGDELFAGSLDEALRIDNAARANVIVDAVRSGEASDIVVIDRDALGPDGLEMLEKLNQLGHTIPVPAQAIADANAGAAVNADPANHGDLRLDFKTCRAYWKGRPVGLTITEFNIVCLFARRIGENLTYREIYDVVHGEGFCAGEGTRGYQTNVRSLIKRIRQKFHASDESFTAIENHRGFGYRWQTPDGAPTAAISAGDEIATTPARSLVLMVLLASQAAG
jgi:DNA-binding response OmpR family regulator